MNGPGSGPPSSGCCQPLSRLNLIDEYRLSRVSAAGSRAGPPWMTGGLDALASSGAQVNEEQLE